jgi:hypothetical protein
MKWFARSLCLLLLVALCGQSWAHPLHVKTQITEVFTGWEADKFGIITVDPVANPAKCKLDTHGQTASSQVIIRSTRLRWQHSRSGQR